MARLQTNLVLDGQQVTLSVDSGEQNETEFLTNFKDIVSFALDNGYARPTAPSAGPAGAPSTGADGLIWKPVTEIVISTLPAGQDGEPRAKVEYWGDDIKQPRNDYFTVQQQWTPAKLVEMFDKVGSWTEAHFKQNGKYSLKMEVGYALSSKLNSAGNPYKNVKAVRPVGGAPAETPAPEVQEALPDPTGALDIPF